jgi:hypothetical protein
MVTNLPKNNVLISQPASKALAKGTEGRLAFTGSLHAWSGAETTLLQKTPDGQGFDKVGSYSASGVRNTPNGTALEHGRQFDVKSWDNKPQYAGNKLIFDDKNKNDKYDLGEPVFAYDKSNKQLPVRAANQFIEDFGNTVGNVVPGVRARGL